MQYFTVEITSFEKLHFSQIFSLYVVSQQKKEWNKLNQKRKKHHKGCCFKEKQLISNMFSGKKMYLL